MGTIQKLTIVGGALGVAPACSSWAEERPRPHPGRVVPGLLTLAFAAIGGWGGFCLRTIPRRPCRRCWVLSSAA